MTGLQVGTFVAPGLVMGARSDILTANTAYAGVVTGRSVFGAQFEMEARRDFTNGLWDSMISSGRTAWYYKFAPRVLLTLDDELSIARRGLVPTQLTFSDPLGGVRGYAPSRLVGAERNVVRAEFRWAGPCSRAPCGCWSRSIRRRRQPVGWRRAVRYHGIAPEHRAERARGVSHALQAPVPAWTLRCHWSGAAFTVLKFGSAVATPRRSSGTNRTTCRGPDWPRCHRRYSPGRLVDGAVIGRWTSVGGVRMHARCWTSAPAAHWAPGDRARARTRRVEPLHGAGCRAPRGMARCVRA